MRKESLDSSKRDTKSVLRLKLVIAYEKDEGIGMRTAGSD